MEEYPDWVYHNLFGLVGCTEIYVIANVEEVNNDQLTPPFVVLYKS